MRFFHIWVIRTFTVNCVEENGDEIIGTFYEKELQETNQQEFRIENVIQKKGDKLYVKCNSIDCNSIV